MKTKRVIAMAALFVFLIYSACTSTESEVKKDPHPRSFIGIVNFAAYRGDEIGVEFAEAFIQVRRLWQ